MSRDGLLPRLFGKVHPKFHTPYVGTIIVGVLACLLAGFMPLSVLGELVSMGTLLAFATVCVGVLILRRTWELSKTIARHDEVHAYVTSLPDVTLI